MSSMVCAIFQLEPDFSGAVILCNFPTGARFLRGSYPGGNFPEGLEGVGGAVPVTM